MCEFLNLGLVAGCVRRRLVSGVIGLPLREGVLRFLGARAEVGDCVEVVDLVGLEVVGLLLLGRLALLAAEVAAPAPATTAGCAGGRARGGAAARLVTPLGVLGDLLGVGALGDVLVQLGLGSGALVGARTLLGERRA